MHRPHRNKLTLISAALCVCAAVGCHRGPAMYQVRGKVSFVGGQPPKAIVRLVNFVPSKNSSAEVRRGASGAIAEDGSFTMFTKVDGDGVYAGEYSVLFNFARGAMDATQLIPPKYYDVNSPPYTINVDRNMDGLDWTIDMSARATAQLKGG